MKFKLWLENAESVLPNLLVDKAKMVYDIIASSPDYQSAREKLQELSGNKEYFSTWESFYDLLATTNRKFTEKEKIDYLPKFMKLIELCKEKFKNPSYQDFFYFMPLRSNDSNKTNKKYHIQINPEDIDKKIPNLIIFMSENQNLFYQFKLAKTHHTNNQTFDHAEWDRADKMVIYLTKDELESNKLKEFIEKNNITSELGSDEKFINASNPSQKNKYSNTETWAIALDEYLKTKKGYPKEDWQEEIFKKNNHPELIAVLKQRIEKLASMPSKYVTTIKPQESKQTEQEYDLGDTNTALEKENFGTILKLAGWTGKSKLESIIKLTDEQVEKLNLPTFASNILNLGNIVLGFSKKKLIGNTLHMGNLDSPFLKRNNMEIKLTPEQLAKLKIDFKLH